MTFSSALGPIDRVTLCTFWLDEGLEGDADVVGEGTGDKWYEGVEVAFAGVGCPGGVSGPSAEVVGISSWNPDDGGDRGGESRFASIEAGQDSDVP